MIRMAFGFVVLLLLGSVAAHSAEPSSESTELKDAARLAVLIEDYADRSKLARQSALVSLQANAGESPYDDTPEGRKKHAAWRKTRIEELEDPTRQYYAELDLQKAQAGSMGMVTDGDVNVIQVIDASNALIQVLWMERYVSGSRRLSEQEVIPVYDHRKRTVDYWLSGVRTEDLTDGHGLMLSGIYAVLGTKSYPTAGGSTRTIMRLQQVDIEPFADRFTRKDELRTWTSKEGGHTTEAIFVRADRSRVTLAQPDGKQSEVPLDKLSDADRQFVREQTQKLKPPEPPAAKSKAKKR